MTPPITLVPADAPVPLSTTPAGRVTCYPPDAILTVDEVADVLGVDRRTVSRYPIRKAYLSQQTVRYLFRDVVDFVNARAA